MTDPLKIIPLYQSFNGKRWEKFNSEKVANLAYARIQGKQALIAHFQNSSLMNEDKRCRPILFHSDGPNAGDQEPFPVGVTVRSKRSGNSSGGSSSLGASSSSSNILHHGSPGSSSSSRESSFHGGDSLMRPSLSSSSAAASMPHAAASGGMGGLSSSYRLPSFLSGGAGEGSPPDRF
eukprot:TRINITY_DN11478_c0_g2_i2.p1 TRINITY_DN11478_c0_g2~~TRINITY_DN11478_c0_g2_i2.p1  ORF type:complete len:178 (-),score=3.46 TRINITY_DN11478_c0_g2_i2:360-893(-)